MMERLPLFVRLMSVFAISTLCAPVLGDPLVGSILPPTPIGPTLPKQAPLLRDLGRLPLSFESNQGQSAAGVRFLTHSGDSALFLTPSEAVFRLTAPPAKSALLKRQNPHEPPKPGTQVAFRMQIVGANPEAGTLEQQPLPGRVNYFIGNDPRKWHTGVPTFGRVGFYGVYPGVDLIYYGNQRNLEYDFVVAPHADPKQIQLSFAGAQGVRIDSAGDLIVRTQGQELKWRKPAVYQQDATGKRTVAAHFRRQRLANGQEGVCFALGRYDTARPLVIDPVLVYSTYLGGTTSDRANGIALDSSGNAYITGTTGSADFPIISGAVQSVKMTGTDAFITKINAAGTALAYSTYIGGNSTLGDGATGIAVDSGGNAYITGFTHSANFPVTPGAFQSTKRAGSNGTNAFVTKVNPTGTVLGYSTYLGGSSAIGDSAIGIGVDSNGNVCVAGNTHSTDFPTTALSAQPVKLGGTTTTSAFVTRLNDTGTLLIFSTFLGGSGNDHANAIAVDMNGNAYVTGAALSVDFPTTEKAYKTTKNSETDAFVARLDLSGGTLIYSTFLGGSANTTTGFGIAVDEITGAVYVTGSTFSADFPVTAGAFQSVKHGTTTDSDAFVTKLNPAGNALLYSTFLGGTSNVGETATGIAIDTGGTAYITGNTDAADFPTTSGGFQRIKKNGTGAMTGFVSRVNAGGTALLYSTFLGGSAAAGDMPTGIAADNNGNAYVAGYTYSTDFPITAGAFQTANRANASNFNAFVTRIPVAPVLLDFNYDGDVDLLLQNPSTGAISAWYMQGAQQVGSAAFSLTPPSDFALVGAGDFSGDGNTTLVLQSKTTNQIAFWYTGGANHTVIPGGNFVNTTPAAGWKVVGVGDFNGDGKSDLVFQNQTTNQVAFWFMNGYLYQGGVLMPFTPPAGWTVVGAGSLNADSMTDLVFQNQTTGQIALWYMNGSTYAGGTVLTAVPASGWKVVGVGDYNGDGSADLVFQNQTTNQAAIWYLTNGAFAGGTTLSATPPSGWKIVGPR